MPVESEGTGQQGPLGAEPEVLFEASAAHGEVVACGGNPARGVGPERYAVAFARQQTAYVLANLRHHRFVGRELRAIPLDGVVHCLAVLFRYGEKHRIVHVGIGVEIDRYASVYGRQGAGSHRFGRLPHVPAEVGVEIVVGHQVHDQGVVGLFPDSDFGRFVFAATCDGACKERQKYDIQKFSHFSIFGFDG